jgi:hypothetical protein
MSKYFIKYNKQYSYLFLASYLLLVSLTIFHYHHVNIQSGFYNYESRTESDNPGPFDKQIDFTHECTVQQFTSTVLNYSFNGIFISERDVKPQVYIPIVIEILPTNLHYNSNPLRAPPSIG